MVYPVNKDKQKFKQKFLEYVETLKFGDFISDQDVKDFVSKINLEIEYRHVQAYIRDLELEIGVKLKKRLKRIRKEGYLVLEPTIQANTAIREGKQKVQTALKKTSRRLDAVDVDNFTMEQKNELLTRTSAVNAILNIIENSSITKKIVNKKEVELLSHTAISSKRIKEDI